LKTAKNAVDAPFLVKTSVSAENKNGAKLNGVLSDLNGIKSESRTAVFYTGGIFRK
jgi:hypothetical protein